MATGELLHFSVGIAVRVQEPDLAGLSDLLGVLQGQSGKPGTPSACSAVTAQPSAPT